MFWDPGHFRDINVLALSVPSTSAPEEGRERWIARTHRVSYKILAISQWQSSAVTPSVLPVTSWSSPSGK